MGWKWRSQTTTWRCGHWARRVSYFSTDRAGVEQMVRDVQEEKDGGRDAGMLAALWQVSFYPDTDEPGIVEILLK